MKLSTKVVIPGNINRYCDSRVFLLMTTRNLIFITLMAFKDENRISNLFLILFHSVLIQLLCTAFAAEVKRRKIKHIKNHKFPFNYLLLSTNCGIIQFSLACFSLSSFFFFFSILVNIYFVSKFGISASSFFLIFFYNDNAQIFKN